MLVFLTGATGFLGSHVACVLAEQGADLRLLVRPTSNLKNLEGLKAETATGDLRDPASLEKAMAGDLAWQVGLHLEGELAANLEHLRVFLEVRRFLVVLEGAAHDDLIFGGRAEE